MNKDGEYSNPRNLVSGSIRQLDSRIAAKRRMRFVLWKVPVSEGSYADEFENARDAGFDVVPYIMVNNDSDLDHIVSVLRKIARDNSYPIDGLVFSYDDIEYGLSLGRTEHHPKHSVAFKWINDAYDTTLTDVEWQVGKTGVISPVAIFDPVDLDGAITTRATLHNISYMKNLELGIGDTIQVIRSNEVIPRVVDNLTRSNSFDIPTICPVCGGEAKVHKDNDSEVLYCENPNCKGKLLGKLSHAVSRDALNITGLSEETLSVLINKGWVNSILDIYHLDQHKIDMMRIPGFGRTKVINILNAIEKSRDTTLERVIYAQSVPLVGKKASKIIAKKCKDMYDFIDEMQDRRYPFIDLDSVGDAMSVSLRTWWKDAVWDFLELCNEMNFEVVEDKKTEVLNEAVFVITGKLKLYPNRDALVAAIENNGGKVSGSVSAKTSFLINNDVNSTSSKNKKAKELGVKIITEQEFEEMIK